MATMDACRGVVWIPTFHEGPLRPLPLQRGDQTTENRVSWSPPTASAKYTQRHTQTVSLGLARTAGRREATRLRDASSSRPSCGTQPDSTMVGGRTQKRDRSRDAFIERSVDRTRQRRRRVPADRPAARGRIAG